MDGSLKHRRPSLDQESRCPSYLACAEDGRQGGICACHDAVACRAGAAVAVRQGSGDGDAVACRWRRWGEGQVRDRCVDGRRLAVGGAGGGGRQQRQQQRRHGGLRHGKSDCGDSCCSCRIKLFWFSTSTTVQTKPWAGTPGVVEIERRRRKAHLGTLAP